MRFTFHIMFLKQLFMTSFLLYIVVFK